MKTTIFLAAYLIAQAPTAGLSDSAVEWLKFGLLGLVLCWLFFVHMPAKDKQAKEQSDSKDTVLKEMLKANAEEREKEREEREKERKARHDMANTLQVTTNTLTLGHEKNLLQLTEMHRAEAERDRTAFMMRTQEQGNAINNLKTAIENQTMVLVAAIEKGACRSESSRKL